MSPSQSHDWEIDILSIISRAQHDSYFSFAIAGYLILTGPLLRRLIILGAYLPRKVSINDPGPFTCGSLAVSSAAISNDKVADTASTLFHYAASSGGESS